MQDEETDLSIADVNTSSAPKRPYIAPLLNDEPGDSEPYRFGPKGISRKP